MFCDILPVKGNIVRFRWIIQATLARKTLRNRLASKYASLYLASATATHIMIPVDTLGAFFITSVLLALAPGPDNIFVLTQSVLRGRTAGLLVTLGLCTGLLVHTTAGALGVAAIFQASALAFTALKFAGAAYLLYLAWLSFRSPEQEKPVEQHEKPVEQQEKPVEQKENPTAAQLYRRGIIMNITNPKVSIFFLAFLPQFADPARGSLTLQMLLLGVVFIVSTVLVFGGVALAAGSLGEWLGKSGRAQKIMNRVAGVVFIGLAIRLATVER